MEIWILNHYALPPDQPGGTRHFGLARELVKKGHKVTIFASDFHYSKYEYFRNTNGKPYMEEITDGVKFVWIHTPEYHGNGLDRLINMLAYNKGVKKYLSSAVVETPGLILGSAVHLFAVDLAWRLSKKYKSRFVAEVRDFWPFTLVELGKISKYHPLVLLFAYYENKLYKKAEKIITLFENGHKYLEKFVEPERIVYLPNFFDPSLLNIPPQKKFLPENKFNVVYAGAIGVANDLATLMYAAEKLKGYDDICFNIFGDGAEREKWQKFAEEKNPDNVIFHGVVKKDVLFGELQSADLLWLGMKNSRLYEYGFSMNKIYDYLASAVPVIISTPLKNNIIERAGAGKTAQAENPEELAGLISEFYKMPEQERKKLGENGKKYLLENLTAEKIAARFEEKIINS